MQAYVYHWSLRPRPDLRVELEIEAHDANAARREVDDFLRRHDGAGWRVEAVSRTRRSVRAGSPLPPRLPRA